VLLVGSPHELFFLQIILPLPLLSMFLDIQHFPALLLSQASCLFLVWILYLAFCVLLCIFFLIMLILFFASVDWIWTTPFPSQLHVFNSGSYLSRGSTFVCVTSLFRDSGAALFSVACKKWVDFCFLECGRSLTKMSALIPLPCLVFFKHSYCLSY
jgi:hypothetical protein